MEIDKKKIVTRLGAFSFLVTSPIKSKMEECYFTTTIEFDNTHTLHGAAYSMRLFGTSHIQVISLIPPGQRNERTSIPSFFIDPRTIAEASESSLGII